MIKPTDQIVIDDAKRYVADTQNAAAHPEGIPQADPSLSISRIAIIGAGRMGGGIAMACANAGLHVTLIDQTSNAVERGIATVQSTYGFSVARGRLAEGEAETRQSRISGASDFQAAEDADLVIEAVFEDWAVKKDVFTRLDMIAKPGAILATNTSTYDINKIASFTRRPESVLGLHFFSPANVMKLVEIVRGDATKPEVISASLSLARALGKIPVVVGVCFGFVGNRIMSVRNIQADRLLVEGCLPEQIDRVLLDFGFPIGLFTFSDQGSLDFAHNVGLQYNLHQPALAAMVEHGRLGVKTQAGFYRYESTGRTAVAIPDDDVERILHELSAAHGVKRRAFTDQICLERILFPMINEAARIVKEGIVVRPSDVDVVWVNGYGWPARLGGPLYYADHLGLRYIRNRLLKFADESGDATLRPAALLDELADGDRKFTA